MALARPSSQQMPGMLVETVSRHYGETATSGTSEQRWRSHTGGRPHSASGATKHCCVCIRVGLCESTVRWASVTNCTLPLQSHSQRTQFTPQSSVAACGIGHRDNHHPLCIGGGDSVSPFGFLDKDCLFLNPDNTIPVPSGSRAHHMLKF